MTFSNVSVGRAARAGKDRSVLVIAFMMALVFVPVLGAHAAALSLGPDGVMPSWREGVAQVSRLLERASS
ncbi:hypothetical protein [Methylobacterium gregans]|uniref:Uncharacterized protein n=1 Tax=Methylobacterium gregans TaxID=374424 RepID=A0AA37HPE4_9HYPH|nr:hypothetical protein [Methylobacterium gregans]MDQ0521782.1 hypothetical protein [Methylobacterium gregans]GJD79211.1 hypothetical protein NBEOAGPD_2434 [Methylobacterium gregans]GLS52152.1 hypothetical protein GCM10007886_03340 [Methylobacterium gregans]